MTAGQAAYQIVHCLPGRMRLRLLRKDERSLFALEHVLRQQSGVLEVRGNSAANSLVIYFEPGQFDVGAFLDSVDFATLATSSQARQAQKARGVFGWLRQKTFAFEAAYPPQGQCVISALALTLAAVEAPSLAVLAALWASIAPILNRALQTLLDEKRLGADALDGTTCVLLARQGSIIPAATMTFLISLGELVRELITRRCQSIISYQAALSRQSVWLTKGHKRVRTPVAQLKTNDQFVVYAGEVIPCQGSIVSGHGTVVPASPAKDFEPRFVQRGDTLSGWEVLLDGKLYVSYQAKTATPHDPVKEKQSKRWLQRTQLHRCALKIGHQAVMPLLGLSAVVFAITRDINRALPIVCFDFITGVRITVPVAMLSSMCKAGNHGIIIRNAAAMEKLAAVDTVIFARSGTLTSLRPSVSDVFVADGFTLAEVMKMAAAVEQRFSHVAAYAIYSYANIHTIPVPERETASVIAGLGVKGIVEGHQVLVGSTRLMDIAEISLANARAFLDQAKLRGDSRVCVAIDGKVAGVISYQDPVRPEARRVVSSLKSIGVSNVAMMTGGNESAARAFAAKIGIDMVHHRTLPEDQAAVVEQYRRGGHKVAVVGYDVDDSLALERADVAIAMSTGTDVAKFRADVLLTSESLRALVEGIRISREAVALAKQNLAVVSGPNALGLLISVINQTDYLSATLLNNGSVIVGAINGLRPLYNQGR